MKNTGNSDAQSRDVNYLVGDTLNSKIDQIRTLISPFLENIHKGIPGYVDHGVEHSKGIIDLLNALFENFEFSESEKYLLYLSAWLHDIGCVVGNGHAKKSTRILELHRSMFEAIIGSRTINPLKIIIETHDCSLNIDKVAEMESHLEKNDTRLRFISALFRVVDACHLGRANKCLYETLRDFNVLDEESIVHWEAHLAVDSIRFEFENEAIVINAIDKDKADVLKEDIESDLKSVVHVFADNNFPIKRVKVRKYGIVDN